MSKQPHSLWYSLSLLITLLGEQSILVILLFRFIRLQFFWGQSAIIWINMNFKKWMCTDHCGSSVVKVCFHEVWWPGAQRKQKERIDCKIVWWMCNIARLVSWICIACVCVCVRTRIPHYVNKHFKRKIWLSLTLGKEWCTQSIAAPKV